jgi:hypothetical protein
MARTGVDVFVLAIAGTKVIEQVSCAYPPEAKAIMMVRWISGYPFKYAKAFLMDAYPIHKEEFCLQNSSLWKGYVFIKNAVIIC